MSRQESLLQCTAKPLLENLPASAPARAVSDGGEGGGGCRVRPSSDTEAGTELGTVALTPMGVGTGTGAVHGARVTQTRGLGDAQLPPRLTPLGQTQMRGAWSPFEPAFSSLLHLSILVGNPFNCSCGLRWLQLWQNSSRAELGNQSLGCWEGSVLLPLGSWALHTCGTWPGIPAGLAPGFVPCPGPFARGQRGTRVAHPSLPLQPRRASALSPRRWC